MRILDYNAFKLIKPDTKSVPLFEDTPQGVRKRKTADIVMGIIELKGEVSLNELIKLSCLATTTIYKAKNQLVAAGKTTTRSALGESGRDVQFLSLA